MKLIFRQARAIALQAVVLLGLAGTGPATAELLGIETTTPPIVNSTLTPTGNYSFDSGTGIGTFSLTGAFVNIAELPDPVGLLFASTGGLQGVTIDVQFGLNAAGEVVDSGTGNNFVMTGEIDTDGDGNPDLFSPLLTGQIKDFGFRNQSSTDLFDMRFGVTGGDLAAAYFGNDDIGVEVTGESSTFDGLFDRSFGFSAKVTAAPVPQVCVDIEKQVSIDGLDWRDADSEGDALLVQVPGSVQYRLIVANCGDANLKDVVVSDATLPGTPSFSIGALPVTNNPLNPVIVTQAQMPGLFVADRCAEPGILPNVAKVMGQADSPLTAEFVSDMDEAYVECFAIGAPQIEVIKEVRIPPSLDWFDANTPAAAPTGTLGSDAEYRITIRNLSTEFTVSNPTVEDATLGINVPLIGTLAANDGAPGGLDEVVLTSDDAGFNALSITAACTTGSIGEVMNMVQVTGAPAPVNPAIPDDPSDMVSDDDPAYRICVEPQIEIVKEVRRAGSTDPWLDANDIASALALPFGADAEYRFSVTNIGPVELTNAVVTDDDLGVSATIDLLPPGDTQIIDGTYPGLVGELIFDCRPLGSHMNVVNVTAIDPLTLNTVTDDDLAFVDCKFTDVRIVKEVRFEGTDTWFDANDDVGLTDVPAPMDYPANVEYRITVTNVGMFDIENVEVSDPTLLGGETIQLGTIPANGSVELTPTTPIANADLLVDNCDNAGRFVNIASVSATVVWTSETISDTDEALFICQAPTNASIGDRVWEDLNGNGEQDGGEPGIEGVLVELLDDLMIPTGAQDITDAGGAYLFTDLEPGIYFVRFTNPDGFTLTTPNAVGVADTADSDAVDEGAGTAKTGPIELDAAENDLTNDAGYVRLNPATIGDFVWEDINGNGIQDAGEPGIPDAAVGLKDESGVIVQGPIATDADGKYSFTVAPGTYSVVIQPPPGFTYTSLNAGTDNTVDSDADPAMGGMTETVTVDFGETNNTLDGGLYRSASLGDFVWIDTDGDGIQDELEPGVEGVTVELLDADMNPFDPVRTTTTGLGGTYVFDDLMPGTYFVQFTAPDGRSFTTPNVGADPSVDSNAGVDGKTDPIALVSGDQDLTIDAGLVGQASLGDRVWEDVNANGQQDAGEPGIEGVLVELLDSGMNPTGQTATTDANGLYGFTMLEPGSYFVRFTDPAGFTLTTPNATGVDDADDSDAVDEGAGTAKTGEIVLDTGENDPTNDAGYYQPATIGDFVWEDTNGNGIQDAGEPGIPGVPVLLKDADGNVIPSSGDVTDANGEYSISVAPGTYSVVIGQPDGFEYTTLNAGADNTVDSDADPAMGGMTETVTVASGETNDTLDGGLYQPASLGDFVWEDSNGNGIQDPVEPGVSGVTVELLDVDMSPIGGGTLTTTDANGAYGFADLTPGTYFVQFTAPDGRSFTTQGAGSDPTVDSNAGVDGKTGPVELASGENDPTIDAGLVGQASLGDQVWEDQNRNGQQDAGEPGIEGVLVELLDSGMNPTGQTDTTDANGLYGFTMLEPGSYFVRFTDPAGFTLTTPNATGVDDADDSDAVDEGAGTAKTGEIVLDTGENDPTNDAGYFQPVASLGDRVWLDRNGNGVQDSGEPGVGGVPVELLDQDMNPIGGGTTTTTDGSGLYSFDGLTPGTYFVRFTTPDGFVLSEPNVGDDDAADSDAVDLGDGTGKTGAIVLEAGENDPTNDAGIYRPAALGDFAWEDLNGDGLQDTGEPGLMGVDVELLDENMDPVVDPVTGDPVTTQTDADGMYLFGDLNPGSYFVQFIAPEGCRFTQRITNDTSVEDINSDADPANGKTDQIDLVSGEINLDVDVGLICDASLGDRVWDDLNGNGLQDAGEPGVEGVLVELLDADMAPTGATDTTDTNGIYGFAGLQPGSYFVRFTAPENTAFTTPGVGADPAIDSNANPVDGKSGPIALDSGENDPTIDAGIIRLVPAIDIRKQAEGPDSRTVVFGNSIDFLIVVTNTGETDLTDVVVSDPLVPDCDKTIGSLAVGANDAYTCTASNVTIGFTNIASVTGNGPNGTPVSDDDPSTVTVIIPPATIGDFVWEDVNRNGIQDADEPGVDGVTVNLKDADGLVIQTTTTSGGGAYSFTVDPGTYSVQFELPSGFSFTALNVGVNDAVDSDADPAMGGMTDTTTLSPGGNDPTLDAGLVLNTCDIVVDKTCSVIPPPSGDLECTAKIAATTMRYTGPSISGATVVFEPKAAPSVTYSGIDLVSGVTVLTMPAENGFSVDGAPDDSDLGSKLKISINGVVEEIHTSCSAPYIAGQPAPLNSPKGAPSPNWTVVNFRDKNGVFVTESVPQAGADSCTISSTSGVECTKRPTEIQFRISGGDCGASDNDQPSDKFSCDDLGSGDIARVLITTKDGSKVYLDQSAGVGDVVTVDPAAVGRSEVDSELSVKLFSASNQELQSIKLHTSCSQPLATGDVFGGLTVVSYTNPEQGTVTLGSDIQYDYLITNSGDTSIQVTSVLDDPLGELLAPSVVNLGTGESTALTTTTFVDGSITNLVTVTANVDGLPGATCVATDTVVVTLEGQEVPGIDIRKQEEGPDSRTFSAGDTVNFEIEVRNTGNIGLSGVTVSDPLLAACDADIGNLSIGQSVTYSCSTVLSGGSVSKEFKDTFSSFSYDNNDGTDDFAGPWFENDKEDGNTQDPTDGNVLIGSNNKLWLDDYPHTGTDPSAQRTADLSGLANATLDFDWSTHAGVDTSDAVVVEVSSDGGSTWTVLHTFTGFSGAQSGHKTFDISGAISSDTTVRFRVSKYYGGSDETFKVDNFTITGEGGGPASGFVNEACVDGVGNGRTVSDCDTSEVVVDTVGPLPAIDIRKQEEGPDSRPFSSGDTVNFEIAVTNTGNVDLSGVTVSDPLLAACDAVIGNMAIGQSVTYSCSTVLSGGSASKEFKDTFSSISYNNNDGTDDFAAPWFENDKEDGYTQDPTDGNVLIGDNNKLWLDDYPHTGTDPSAQRAADLSGLDNATLDFDWSTHAGVDTSDAVVVEVSSDGGTTWTTLHTFTGFSGAKSGHKTFDITGYVSSQTTVRFRVSKYYGAANETFKVDNFTITGSGSGVATGFTNEACVAGTGEGQSVSDCDTSEVVLDDVVEPPPVSTVSTCSDLKPVTGLRMIWDGPNGVDVETELGQTFSGVNKGDVITFDSPQDQTGNDFEVFVSGALNGTSTFHISCSDRDMNGIEDCGKLAGDGKKDSSRFLNEWIFNGMIGEKGAFFCP